MQDQTSDAGNENVPPTAAEDIRDQGIVLIHVLAVHPTHLIVPETSAAAINGPTSPKNSLACARPCTGRPSACWSGARGCRASTRCSSSPPRLRFRRAS